MKPLLVVVLSLSLLGAGCSSTTVAQRAQTAIALAVSIAQAEEQLVPAADQPAYNSFVALAQSLDVQLGTCLSNVGGLAMNKSAKFLSCFNTFASALLSPAELAQLRLLSPGVQDKVKIYAAAIVAGVNIAVAALGGKPVALPAEAVPSPAVHAQLEQVEQQMRVAAGL